MNNLVAILNWIAKHTYYCAILFVLTFWLCGGIPTCSSPNEQEVKALKAHIKELEKERGKLEIQRDSLNVVADSLEKHIIKSKNKTKTFNEDRNKTNFTILGMPDDQLLRTFSKFDSRSNQDQ